MPLAPIALFVYNRPEHTYKVLQSLKRNKLAESSTLTVFCDGMKENASREDLYAIQQVRKIAASEKWCRDVQLIVSENNIGLADSIVKGVSQLVREHGKIIVLEDDLVTSPGFLEFLNKALDIYEKEERVMHVSAYMYPRLRLPFSHRPDSAYFIKFMACWGWATWKKAWDCYNDSAKDLLTQIRSGNSLDRFNLDGRTGSLSWQLQQNADGKLHTWAIKWYASIFLKDGLCLFPSDSLVRNIGNDGTGTHPDRTNLYAVQKITSSMEFTDIPLEEDKRARKQISDFFRFLEKKKTLPDKVIEKLHLLR